ncbi:MAG: hypothetical protein C0430_06425 [Flavobacterium sp.]|nr:hypothetical protein [Flavobacterium sp.]
MNETYFVFFIKIKSNIIIILVVSIFGSKKLILEKKYFKFPMYIVLFHNQKTLKNNFIFKDLLLIP